MALPSGRRLSPGPAARSGAKRSPARCSLKGGKRRERVREAGGAAGGRAGSPPGSGGGRAAARCPPASRSAFPSTASRRPHSARAGWPPAPRPLARPSPSLPAASPRPYRGCRCRRGHGLAPPGTRSPPAAARRSPPPPRGSRSRAPPLPPQLFQRLLLRSACPGPSLPSLAVPASRSHRSGSPHLRTALSGLSPRPGSLTAFSCLSPPLLVQVPHPHAPPSREEQLWTGHRL